MTWRELLQTGNEALVAPWLGGRTLRSGPQSWTIDGRLPREIGWYNFKLQGRRATLDKGADPNGGLLENEERGYLVGDRIVPDHVHVDPDPFKIIGFSEPVALLDPGLDRFVRVVAGRPFEDGPLVFKSQDFPLGPEDAVLQAYFDRKTSVGDIPNVLPALDAAFRMETWMRAETERRRLELERLLKEEEERRQLEERRRHLAEQLGTGQGRRVMAQIDFAQAAKAALGLSGAEYLDHKKGYTPGEMIVTFRFNRQQYTCTCDNTTLRIIDAGICLTDHTTGEKGDTRFTLESLPAVILGATRRQVLVINRHAGNPGIRVVNHAADEDFEGEDFED
jgi:hypothetical protein